MLHLALTLSLACLGQAAELPPLVTRAQWGSRPQPIPDSRKQTPVWITLHHASVFWTPGKDPAQFVRNLQAWGQSPPEPPRKARWPDLPYHYMIAPDGRIFEARPVEYEPETNTNYSVNGNIGVELMGDFESQRPSIQQLRAAVALTAWLSQRHGIGLDRVRGHKDAAQGQTDCPGRDFQRYLEDGQFRDWAREALNGRQPDIAPGLPLREGPTAPIPVGPGSH